MAAMTSAVNRPAGRPYRSPARAEGARNTRRQMLTAAYRLFVDQGYPRTTLAEIASAAGVSVETVYKTFKNKRGLLKELADFTVGGDDEQVAVLERPDPLLLRDETDQLQQLAMFAAGMTGLMERVRPFDDIMRSAAAVDPEVAALRDDLQLRQRRGAMTTIAGWLAARGPLRDGVEGAAAVLWTLTSPEVNRMLRVDWGWTPQQYEAWLRTTLEAALLPGRTA
jgi:AcrR family transcriptional regulator